MAVSLRARSSSEHRGRVFIVTSGGALATHSTPADLWFAGDTGAVRPALLRAHPVVDDGMLRSRAARARDRRTCPERLGSGGLSDPSCMSASPSLPMPPALNAGALGDGRGDVDLGAGLRLGWPGLAGVFRLDLGKGLRDGTTAVSFVYEP